MVNMSRLGLNGIGDVAWNECCERMMLLEETFTHISAEEHGYSFQLENAKKKVIHELIC